MERSENIGALAAALAKAQGAMGSAIKDGLNGHLNRKYATLTAYLDAARKPLASNEIALIQTPYAGSGGVLGLRTTLIHSSGEWIACDLELSLDKPNAQAVGSALTYLRRYSLASILGLSADDDDGEAAESAASFRPTQSAPTPKRPATPPPSAPTNPRDAEVRELVLAIRSMGEDITIKPSDFRGLDDEQYAEWLGGLKATLEVLQSNVEG